MKYSISRREVLKMSALGALGLASTSWPLKTYAQAKSAARPNIILILADDMGYSDLGCFGSQIATPHLDQLAGKGARLTQMYNCARCCPSRAALLTGLYPSQTGVGYMHKDMGHPNYQGWLNDRCATIAELLCEKGYRTGMFGKWHVGQKPDHWPTRRGFDTFFGLIPGASSYWKPKPENWYQNQTPLHVGDKTFYATDAITDHAIEFVNQQQDVSSPFFMYLAYTAPHWPLHAWPEDIERYRDQFHDGWDQMRQRRFQRMQDIGILDKRWPLTPRDEQAPAWEEVPNQGQMQMRMAIYAAMITRMDANIGRLVQALHRMGIDRNTLILFLSDNGACAEIREQQKPDARPGGPDTYVSYGLPWANACNTPFRLFKRYLHEGGISTPMIASWPAAGIDQGLMVNEVSHFIDIMPTCLAAAGVDYPQARGGVELTPLEGRSLLPAMLGANRTREGVLGWEHEESRAVRQGDWKLVTNKANQWELYNLKDDRTEMNNLAHTQARKVELLTKAYDQWAAHTGVVPWNQLPYVVKQKQAMQDG